MLVHPYRLFPPDSDVRGIARRLFEQVQTLPIVSPHGHTQAAWFASNEPFSDPAQLFIQPDHYVFRMLYSQGVSLEDLEIGHTELKDPRNVWRIFASTLLSFPRNADAPVAGFCFPGTLRTEAAAIGRNRRSLLRYDFRKATNSGVPAARAV